MGLLDDTARDVATLPRDAVAMQSPHWRIVRRVQQRLAAEARERQVRMINFDRVGENSRPIEKEWFKTELTRTQQLCDAYRVFDDWWRAARVDVLASIVQQVAVGLCERECSGWQVGAV
jgi:hypothetical protein